MANSLNVRILNNINTIAQGDTASTIQIELLDEHKLVMPNLDGREALINFTNRVGEIVYQVNTQVFDSRVEFNIDAVLPYGKYTLEIILKYGGYTYIFPSNGGAKLNVSKSSSQYYTVAIEAIGTKAVLNDIYNKIKGDFPGALEHASEKDNPHEVTAEQVGLALVPNWSSASQSEAEQGSTNNRFMTPARTKQAIDAQIPIEDREKWNNSASVQYVDDSISNINIPDHTPYDNHLSSTDNPHNVTKTQVGLGNVPNFPISSMEDAEVGTVSESLMTPLRTKQAIDSQVPIGDFSSHMEDSGVHVSPEDRSSWDSKATQTDIDNTLGSLSIPNKADFDQAMDGSNDSTYMTPFKVHQKVTDATKNVVQIVDNVVEFTNPNVTDSSGGYGYYRTIPNFGASVSMTVSLTEAIPKDTPIAKVTGGIVSTRPLEAGVLNESFEHIGVVVLNVSSVDGTILPAEDLVAGHYLAVDGVF